MIRTLVTLAIVGALVLVALLLLQPPGEEVAPLAIPTERTPIAVIEHSSTRQYGSEGRLQYLLKVDRAEQFLRYKNNKPLNFQRGYTDLAQPELTIYAKDNEQPWVFRSKHGRTEHNGELITLWGDVVVSQSITDSDEYQVATQKLEIYPEKQLVTTSEAVNIRTPEGIASAVGLNINMLTGVSSLESQVQGVYEPR
ncbi:LPS export ABC transporter periplasmic protein LptC [Halioxenophilus sp. WMMB6]|uniref:LPS export ABC transporter periplasmic protein LptC n=1 Tax=Halioxenophilus sp. WMMB6 TaxID=3073815 RepID=UPI00295EBA3E|nr:LPS export ABC transporter periplasmic protein LptC [Halioxenophilus sp. WMMB6]